MPDELNPNATYFRWRLKNFARTPWQPVPMRFVAIPANAEGVEFHDGEPSLPPRRREAASSSST